MADEDNQSYIEYIKSILRTLNEDAFYNFFVSNINSGQYQYDFIKKINNKKVEKDWLEIIEDCLIPLDNIVRKPRKFIKQEEDIVSIALAKRITTESVKHLAQHTNMIASISDDGMVTPERILNINKEESLEVYENRFIYTLLLKLDAFIGKRMKLIVESLKENEAAEVKVYNNFRVNEYKLNYKMELGYSKIDALSSESSNIDKMSDIQRVSRAANIVKDFLSSPFSKEMRRAPLVRPPITRTNAILKNPDFKKALVLWQFVESYEKEGFSVETENFSDSIKGPYVQELNDTLFFNYLFMRNFLGEQDFSKKTDKQRSNRKLAKTLISSILDDSMLTEADLQEIYDRLMARKVKAKRNKKEKLNAIIDKAVKEYQNNKKLLEKERIRKEKEEEKRQKKELALKERRKRAEELAKKKREADALAKKERAIELANKKREAELAKKKEAELAKKKREAELAKKKKEAELAKKKEAELAKKKREAELTKKKREAELAKKKKETELAKKKEAAGQPQEGKATSRTEQQTVKEPPQPDSQQEKD